MTHTAPLWRSLAIAQRLSAGGAGRHVTLIALALAMVLLAIDAHAGVRRVWAVNDGEKIERDAREPSRRAATIRPGTAMWSMSRARAMRSWRFR